jgi:3',5'-cyclic AMP phosphodiesterase CpdA
VQRLAWITDIHLDFVGPDQLELFCARLLEARPDAILLSGDISQAHRLTDDLARLSALLKLPIYFVLGNHDFYRGSIASVRVRIEAFCQVCPLLRWLPCAGLVALTPQTGLLGHDGWADGRNGNYIASDVMLNDYLYIGEFIGLDSRQRLTRLQALGDEAAEYFRKLLPEALERFRRLIMLTHVPPFREACWHQGRISDDNWLPHFSCRAVGEVLRKAMAARPDRELLVLCGHTHGAGEVSILPNLRVLTGGADYGRPALQRVLDVV